MLFLENWRLSSSSSPGIWLESRSSLLLPLPCLPRGPHPCRALNIAICLVQFDIQISCCVNYCISSLESFYYPLTSSSQNIFQINATDALICLDEKIFYLFVLSFKSYPCFFTLGINTFLSEAFLVSKFI